MSHEDREHLGHMVSALDASPRTLRRPVCRGWVGDWQINGKSGHILTDGVAGYLLFAKAEDSPRRWTSIKRKLGFAQLTQDGDDEGIFRLDR